MDIVLNAPIELIVLGLGLAGFVALAWFRLDLAAAAIVFLAPAYILRIREPLPYPTNVLEILVWILFMAWATKKFIAACHSDPPKFCGAKFWRGRISPFYVPSILKDSSRPFRMTIMAAALIFLGAIISVSAGGHERLQTSLGQFLVLFVEPLLFILVVRNTPSTSNDMRYAISDKLVLAYIASATVVAFVAFVGALTPLHDLSVTFDGRLRGFYLSPNHLAMYVMPAALLVIGSLSHWVIKYRASDRRKLNNLIASNLVTYPPQILPGIFGVATLLVLLAILYLTHSYGAWFGFFGGLLVLLFLLARITNYRLPITKPRFLLFSLAFLFVVFAAFNEFQGARLQNLFDERGPLASRLMVWGAAVEILKDHPLWGIGIGTFQDYYLAYQQKFPPYLEWAVPQPHNLFLAVWLQAGILGLAGFVWLLVMFARNIFNQARFTNYHLLITTIAAASALAAILLHGLIDTPILKNDLALMFAALLFVMSVKIRQQAE